MRIKDEEEQAEYVKYRENLMKHVVKRKDNREKRRQSLGRHFKAGALES